jgi:hypothetical protein
MATISTAYLDIYLVYVRGWTGMLLFKKIKGEKRMPKTLLGIPMPVKD